MLTKKRTDSADAKCEIIIVKQNQELISKKNKHFSIKSTKEEASRPISEKFTSNLEDNPIIKKKTKKEKQKMN